MRQHSTVTSLFSPFPAKFSRSKFISSFHNIFTPTTCSILFSLDSALTTQPKLFFSTTLTSGIRPLTPKSMWVQFPRHIQGLRHCQPRATSIQLTSLGLSSIATSWFRSYLSNRSQITRVLDSYSLPGFPSSGVPQGSILGPTLFSAFINDLPSVLPLNSTVLFADDMTIFIVSDNICSLQSSLQTCLNLANLWLQRNGLRLNTLKTKSMLIHSS